MKYLLIIIFIISSFPAYAHSGRTNAEGCHTNRKTDKYHCHKAKTVIRDPFAAPEKITNSQTYDRKLYGSWIDLDHDCQNTRHEVLIEESLVPVTFKTDLKCKVISGKWYDPYTDQVFTDPSKLDIDHVVPLKESFISGAKSWSREKKKEYANYLKDKGHLIAVSRSANRSKGAKDPALWLPTNEAYHVEYAKIWIQIKKDWDLSFDAAEIAALKRILGGNIPLP